MALAVAAPVAEYRYVDPVVALPSFTASGATGTVHWSASSGELSAATGAGVTLDPSNRTELVIITATDDSASVSVSIQIYGTFPVQPKWGIEIDVDPTSGKIQFPMVYEKRTYEEYFFNVLQFYKWHKRAIIDESEAEDGTLDYKVNAGRPFYVDDIASGILAKVYFDSVMRQSFEAADNVAYSFQFKGYDYEVPSMPATGPSVMKSPLDLGAVAWVEASDSTVSDSSNVTSMTERTGLATISAGSVPPSMKIESGVRMIHGGSGKGLIVTLTNPLDTAYATVFMVARYSGGGGVDYNYLVNLRNNFQSNGALALDSADGEAAWLGGAMSGSGGLLGSQFKVLVGRVDKLSTGSPGDGAMVHMDVRHAFRQHSQFSEAVSARSASSSVAFVGGFGDGQGEWFSGDWRAFAIFDHPLTDDEISSLELFFRRELSLSDSKGARNLIIFDGDSITGGMFGNDQRKKSYPQKALIAQTSPFESYNFAVEGQTCAQMLADQATQVLPRYDATKTHNILLAFAGTNDLAAASVVAQLKLDYAAYCNNARARGFKVIAFTMLPRNAAGISASFETDRQTFNTWLRTQTFYDELCDLGGDHTLGDPGDQNDATYYQTDHIHPTTAGHAVIATTYVIPKIAAALAL